MIWGNRFVSGWKQGEPAKLREPGGEPGLEPKVEAEPKQACALDVTSRPSFCR
jgi:hypothetical protein